MALTYEVAILSGHVVFDGPLALSRTLASWAGTAAQNQTRVACMKESYMGAIGHLDWYLLSPTTSAANGGTFVESLSRVFNPYRGFCLGVIRSYRCFLLLVGATLLPGCEAPLPRGYGLPYVCFVTVHFESKHTGDPRQDTVEARQLFVKGYTIT